MPSVAACQECGHDMSEHTITGCDFIFSWSDDGYPDVCDCEASP